MVEGERKKEEEKKIFLERKEKRGQSRRRDFLERDETRYAHNV
jgi:hypothetical protein